MWSKRKWETRLRRFPSDWEARAGTRRIRRLLSSSAWTKDGWRGRAFNTGLAGANTKIQKYNSLTNTNTQVWLSQAQQRLSPPETPGWEECSSPKNETIGSLSLRKVLTNLEMHRLVQNFRYSYFMSEMSWIWRIYPCRISDIYIIILLSWTLVTPGEIYWNYSTQSFNRASIYALWVYFV